MRVVRSDHCHQIDRSVQEELFNIVESDYVWKVHLRCLCARLIQITNSGQLYSRICRLIGMELTHIERSAITDNTQPDTRFFRHYSYPFFLSLPGVNGQSNRSSFNPGGTTLSSAGNIIPSVSFSAGQSFTFAVLVICY